jgi:hypothetical protein
MVRTVPKGDDCVGHFASDQADDDDRALKLVTTGCEPLKSGSVLKKTILRKIQLVSNISFWSFYEKSAYKVYSNVTH